MNALNRWAASPLRAALAAALVATLGGCASSSPAPVLLTLPPTVAMQAAATAASAPPALVSTRLLNLRRIDVPEYLVSRRVRYRADASTLAEWPNTFWAERIEIGVSREFASALREQLPGWRLCEASCGDEGPTQALQVELVRMDFVRSEHQLQARARLMLWSGDRLPRLLRSEERAYTLDVAADTAQAQAQALTEVLRRLAADAAPLVNDTRP
ncbi:MAG: hypothetical protein JWP52_3677 [Rhizobacter sp.]|nr:hypothetical protein [Rhizobacter sp.]